MPVCERDPWRFQYFEAVPCPHDVRVPTDDIDCWSWYPEHRWIYDKLKVAASQGLAAAPHGVEPPYFPVFSKPMTNLKGMGIGSRVLATRKEFETHYEPGHMWMELLTGPHVSTDCAVENGRPVWSRHATGETANDGMFKCWTVHAEPFPELDAYLFDWIERHMQGYTGMLNFETIGNRIIEAHLRFSDQWCDLYGTGWIEALIGLYATGSWNFDDSDRRTGYSLPLFARHGGRYRHPSADCQARIRAMSHVSSLQITFYETKNGDEHPMPPGGFRLGIVNCTDLEAGQKALAELARAFPNASTYMAA